MHLAALLCFCVTLFCQGSKLPEGGNASGYVDVKLCKDSDGPCAGNFVRNVSKDETVITPLEDVDFAFNITDDSLLKKDNSSTEATNVGDSDDDTGFWARQKARLEVKLRALATRLWNLFLATANTASIKINVV